MLQQTQVKTVLPFWQRWMLALPRIQDLAKARSTRIHKLWEGLGYYTRVRNLQKAAQLIMTKHRGRFPRNFEDVLSLPGIGPYTAGAICSIAFNQPKPILDGNVIRVITRLFGIKGDPRQSKVKNRLWKLAEELVLAAADDSRPSACSYLNQSLMELGALICAPKKPKCSICPVADFCSAFRNNRVHQFPHRAERPRPTARRFFAFVAQKNDGFLVRQRPAGIVNAHLWEFPNLEILQKDGDVKAAALNIFGIRPAAIASLCTINHTITRYRIKLEVFRIIDNRAGHFSIDGGKWLNKRKLRLLPFPSAHQRIITYLGAQPIRHFLAPPGLDANSKTRCRQDGA